MVMGSDEFIAAVEAKAKTGVGYLVMRSSSPLARDRYDHVTIQFINVPREKGQQRGGAVAMNNRLLMFVDGFGRGQNEPPPTGKVKLTFGATELLRSRPRGKTATPSKMADHVAKLITDGAKLEPMLNPAKSRRRTKGSDELVREWVETKQGVGVNELWLAKKYAQARADHHGATQAIYKDQTMEVWWIDDAKKRAPDPYYAKFVSRVEPQKGRRGNPARLRLTESEMDTLETLVMAITDSGDPEATRHFYRLDEDGRYESAKRMQPYGLVEIVDTWGRGKKAGIEVAITNSGIKMYERTTVVWTNPKTRRNPKLRSILRESEIRRFHRQMAKEFAPEPPTVLSIIDASEEVVEVTDPDVFREALEKDLDTLGLDYQGRSGNPTTLRRARRLANGWTR